MTGNMAQHLEKCDGKKEEKEGGIEDGRVKEHIFRMERDQYLEAQMTEMKKEVKLMEQIFGGVEVNDRESILD